MSTGNKKYEKAFNVFERYQILKIDGIKDDKIMKIAPILTENAKNETIIKNINQSQKCSKFVSEK